MLNYRIKLEIALFFLQNMIEYYRSIVQEGVSFELNFKRIKITSVD